MTTTQFRPLSMYRPARPPRSAKTRPGHRARIRDRRCSTAMMSCLLSVVACRSRPPSMGGWEGHGSVPCQSVDAGGCYAADLPRVTDRDWSPAVIESFVDRAAVGTVAIDLSAVPPGLLSDCRLPGMYTEARGEAGSGQFWATNRPLLGFEEMRSDCVNATHVVAAYSLQDDRFEALAIPLPCPSVREATPAVGCVGRGLTGRERLERARSIGLRWQPDGGQSPGASLEIYALAPDATMAPTLFGLLPSQLPTWPQRDCVLAAHMAWLREGYGLEKDAKGAVKIIRWERYVRPEVDIARSEESCLYRPIFLSCFPELFRPKQLSADCWVPATLDTSNSGP
jgi:hypothetical protein